ncbi:MAG TPA: ERF family protein [Ruminiclostridium sp.]
MNKSDSILKLTTALSKFQCEVKNPPNNASNPFFKSKYAPLDVVINTAKALLGKYGLSYIQMPGGNGDSVTCVTTLMCEGEWIESDLLTLKADKVTAQGAGSAITYARRYQLTAILGLAGEEDDDGNAAEGNKKPNKTLEPSSNINTPPPINKPLIGNTDLITEGQAKRLFAISKGNAEGVKTVIGKHGYTSTKDIKKSDYEKIVAEVEQC